MALGDLERGGGGNMARFAFGKGKKRSYWDIEQVGRTLRSHDVNPVSPRLPGYQTFASESAARAELERLSAEHIAEGFSPADHDAHAIAGLVAKPAAQPVAVTFPVRKDTYVYNEATGFMVTSMDMAGVTMDEGSKKWNKAVADGKMIPVTLMQDDPFVVRVVAGDPLTPQEEEEWVAKLDWVLDVPSGKVAITGGAVLVNEEYDPDDRYFQSYLRYVDVPPGRYRATVYTYVPGINGDGALDELAGGYDAHERYGAWFRRTRPGEEFPPWLVEWCVGEPDEDPGHEKEWQNRERPDNSAMPEYINFVLHLTLDPNAQAPGKPPEVGWFGEAENARKPERAPRGLEGRDVAGHYDESSGGWMYLFQIPEAARRFAWIPIEGGPVEVEPGEIGLLYRIARFTHGHTVPELRATLPDASGFTAPLQGPPETLVLLQGRELQIAFGNNQRPDEIVDRFEALAPLIANLPDGTELEMQTGQLDEPVFEAQVPVGLHRYRGRMIGGKWQIAESFPKVDAAIFRGALALAREVAAGDAISIHDGGEGDAVMKFANANFKIWIEDNPGKIEGGRLALGTREPGVLSLYGSSVFAVRFRETWPVVDFSGDDAEDEDDDDEDVDLSIPVQGKKLLESPTGRMYFATMSLLVSESLAERIQKEEKALFALGYKHVGDIVSNLAPKVAIRSYAKEGGDTWATYLVAAPDTLVFEMSTRFEKDDASLLTTRLTGAIENLKTNTYKQSVTEGTFAEMEAKHTQRKTELAAVHGAPIPVERTHSGLAAAVEAAMKKQLG
jgi:hypothetical protein